MGEKITKAIGPLLRKRQLETGTHFAVESPVPVGDKKARAQPIQGRMSLGKVFFPANAPWTIEAVDQVLKFPFDTHDDFVDALGMFGRALDMEVNAHRGSSKPAEAEPKPGTMGWYKRQRTAEQTRNRKLKATRGW